MKKYVECLRNQQRASWLLVFVTLAMGTVFGAYAYSGDGGYDAPYFQADYIQDLSEYTSPLVNPALIYRVNQMHLEGGGYTWGTGNGLGFAQLSFITPIKRNQSAGFTALLAGAKIQEMGFTAGGTDLVATGSELRFGDQWLIGNYGVRLLPWFMVGGNLKLRLTNQFGVNTAVSMPGLDAGVYFNPLDNYLLGDLGFSITLQDFVPAKTEWKKTGGVSTNIVATRARFGSRYSVFNDKFIVYAEGVVDNAFTDIYKNLIKSVETDSNGAVKISEASVEDMKKAIRFGAGLRYMFIPQLWLKAGWTNNNIPYVGVKANGMFPLPEMINYVTGDFNIGYSFWEGLFGIKDERGLTVMAKGSVDFGPTREQRLSKELYDKLSVSPMNAYIEAMKLYEAQKYWLASFAFGKVLALFPNFHLNDKVTFYMGDCYSKLYMNKTAREMFQEGLEKFTTSETRAKYLYGLMQLDYREGKYDDALKNHAFIVNLYPDHEIRGDADYLAGEVHFARKNYGAAEQLFSNIKPKSPAYLYGQYTLAIIDLENKKPELAKEALKKVIAADSANATNSISLLSDAAYLKLGHIYFEEVLLTKAVTEAYKKVSAGSAYGDEASLAIAWCFVKVSQPSFAEPVLDQLISSYPKSPYIPEAYLLKGYANMLNKRYESAKSLFDQAVQLSKGTFVTEADLDAKQKEYVDAENIFQPTADNIKKNALRRPNAKTEEERGVLKQEYDKFERENTALFNYTLLQKSHTKFLRRKEQILMDAEFALAKVTAIIGSSGTGKAVEVQKDKIQDVDKEILELQKQLDKEKLKQK